MTMRFRRLLGTILIILALTAGIAVIAAQRFGSKAAEAQTVRCSIATIAGEWGYYTTAKTPEGLDVVSVGTFSVASDGKSSFRGWNYVNRPGGVLTENPGDTGTTTVNADCTGTTVWQRIPDDPARFVIVRNGGEIWAVYTKRLSTVMLRRIRALPGQ